MPQTRVSFGSRSLLYQACAFIGYIVGSVINILISYYFMLVSSTIYLLSCNIDILTLTLLTDVLLTLFQDHWTVNLTIYDLFIP